MEFDTSSPIWGQLVAEFSRRIVTGEWQSASKIAGVRELGVNPNTVQRALAELDRQQLCRSERTTGRFVTSDEARIDRLRAELAQGAADDFVRRAQGLGMHAPQAQRLIEERWIHDDHNDHLAGEGTDHDG